MFALALDGAVVAVAGVLPSAARRLDTGQWVTPPDGSWSDEQATACGWLPMVEVARPADTDTTTHDGAVVLVAGVPTQTWTARPWTPDELAARAEAANGVTIRTRAAAALATNRTIASGANTIVTGADTYLAIPAPSTVQAVAQVRALTQAVKLLAQGVNALANNDNALIRLAIDALDATD